MGKCMQSQHFLWKEAIPVSPVETDFPARMELISPWAAESDVCTGESRLLRQRPGVITQRAEGHRMRKV